ncbi:type II CAAX endopeptidase family protein [Nocardioides anomalus]|nr:type II CAAX endopeptidase family protein [Nocardioides anomalus]
MPTAVQTWLRRALWEQVPRDHRQEPRELRRRQLVVVGFVVLGGVALGLSLRLEPGSSWFYPATILLASIWTVGAFVSGPLHLGRIAFRDRHARPIVTPLLLGFGLAAVFVAGALLVRSISWLSFLEDQVVKVVDYADQGSLPILVVITAINGIAEELFFRGAAYAAITRGPVLWTTLLYFVATLATGNVMLAFAAVLLGAVVGLERRASGGILGPILTHCAWSLTMLVALPLVFF